MKNGLKTLSIVFFTIILFNTGTSYVYSQRNKYKSEVEIENSDTLKSVKYYWNGKYDKGMMKYVNEILERNGISAINDYKDPRTWEISGVSKLPSGIWHSVTVSFKEESKVAITIESIIMKELKTVLTADEYEWAIRDAEDTVTILIIELDRIFRQYNREDFK